MNRIINISRLAKMLVAIASAIHICIFFYFTFINANSSETKKSFGENNINLSAIHEKWLSYANVLENIDINSFWVLGTVDFIAQLLIFFYLLKLFSLYEKGIIFNVRNYRYLQLVGITMFAYGLAMIFLPSITSTFINLFLDYPRLEVNYYLGSNEISQLIWSSVILVISWVMKEACLMNEEQGLVI